jgi:hypothetical protein
MYKSNLLVQFVFPNNLTSGEESTIKYAFSIQGYDIRFVPFDIQNVNLSIRCLENTLLRDSYATIFYSGAFWDHINRHIDKYLFPNLIILTANPALQWGWYLRPIAIIHGYLSPSGIQNVLSVLQSIKDESVLYPARKVSFSHTDFGLIRRSILDEPFPKKVWESFREKVWPGFKFTTWSAFSGYLGNTFQIYKISDNSIIVQSPSAKNLQIVPKKDFFNISIDWNEYKLGNIPRYEFRDRTRYSTYIISILHWLDDEGCL